MGYSASALRERRVRYDWRRIRVARPETPVEAKSGGRSAIVFGAWEWSCEARCLGEVPGCGVDGECRRQAVMRMLMKVRKCPLRIREAMLSPEREVGA